MLVEKCSSSSFLLHTPSAFQQARCRAFLRTVLLGRAAIYGHEENNGLPDSPRAGWCCGEGGDGREEPTSQFHACLEGEAIKEIRNVLQWGGGALGGDHQVGSCGFSGRGFDTCGCFLFRPPSSRFSCCCGFRLRLLPDDALRHAPAQVLHQKPRTAVLQECEGVETHTLPPSRDRSALTAALKPLAVDGTTISFSAFSWAARPPGQDARNQARKARMSRTPEMKMGYCLGALPLVCRCWSRGRSKWCHLACRSEART